MPYPGHMFRKHITKNVLVYHDLSSDFICMYYLYYAYSMRYNSLHFFEISSIFTRVFNIGGTQNFTSEYCNVACNILVHWQLITTWSRFRHTPCTLTFLKLSISMLSSWLSLTRLVPTRILSSLLSCSRLSRSRECPWCWMRTHSLFISEKFSRIKSIVSRTVPVSVSLCEEINNKMFIDISEGFQKPYTTLIMSQCTFHTECCDVLISFISIWPCCFLHHIWQDIFCTLEKVVSEEETPEWVLDSTTHLNQVLENIFPGELIGLYIHNPDSDQQVSTK